MEYKNIQKLNEEIYSDIKKISDNDLDEGEKYEILDTLIIELKYLTNKIETKKREISTKKKINNNKSNIEEYINALKVENPKRPGESSCNFKVRIDEDVSKDFNFILKTIKNKNIKITKQELTEVALKNFTYDYYYNQIGNDK